MPRTESFPSGRTRVSGLQSLFEYMSSQKSKWHIVVACFERWRSKKKQTNKHYSTWILIPECSKKYPRHVKNPSCALDHIFKCYFAPYKYKNNKLLLNYYYYYRSQGRGKNLVKHKNINKVEVHGVVRRVFLGRLQKIRELNYFYYTQDSFRWITWRTFV